MPAVIRDSAQQIKAAVAAVCPVLGVTVGTHGVSSSVRLAFDPVATPAQRAAGQSVVDAFDWGAVAETAWRTGKQRRAAADFLSAPEAQHKLLRALAEVIRKELNMLRAAVVPPLPARTPAQLRTAIQNEITAGTVDT